MIKNLNWPEIEN